MFHSLIGCEEQWSHEASLYFKNTNSFFFLSMCFNRNLNSSIDSLLFLSSRTGFFKALLFHRDLGSTSSLLAERKALQPLLRDNHHKKHPSSTFRKLPLWLNQILVPLSFFARRIHVTGCLFITAGNSR